MADLTLRQLAAIFDTHARQMPAREIAGLRAAATIVAEAADGYIGEYQPAAGPFPAWKPLSQATLHGGVSPSGHKFKGKIDLGFAPPDRPLLRTGFMRDTIESSVGPGKMVVGSDDEVAFWQELGTRYMPARSFIGRAMFEKQGAAVAAVMEAMFGPLVRGR